MAGIIPSLPGRRPVVDLTTPPLEEDTETPIVVDLATPPPPSKTDIGIGLGITFPETMDESSTAAAARATADQQLMLLLRRQIDIDSGNAAHAALAGSSMAGTAQTNSMHPAVPTPLPNMHSHPQAAGQQDAVPEAPEQHNPPPPAPGQWIQRPRFFGQHLLPLPPGQVIPPAIIRAKRVLPPQPGEVNPYPSIKPINLYRLLDIDAQRIDISRTLPLTFLTQVSQFHTQIFRPLRAIVYDKAYLLPLLVIHDTAPLRAGTTMRIPTIALVAYNPETGMKQGWKPPVITYEIAETERPIEVATKPIQDAMQDVLFDVLGLPKDQTVAAELLPLHKPLWGAERLPGQDKDAWMIAQVFHLRDGAVPVYNGGKVLAAHRFAAEDVWKSTEIDAVTKGILMAAFAAMEEDAKNKDMVANRDIVSRIWGGGLQRQ